MGEWCSGCQHSGELTGDFEMLGEYLLNTLTPDGRVVLAKYASAKVPICLLLARMRAQGVGEKQWPSSSELVVHYDRTHHEPTGFSPIGNDVNESCTGRKQ